MSTTTSSPPRRAVPLGASLIIVSSLFYASYGIWTTLMGDFFGGYTASAVRSLLVLAILVPIALLTRQLVKIDWRRDRRSFAGLLFTACFGWGPLYYSILHAGIGTSLALNYASIVLGMFAFGWLFSKEVVGRRNVIAGVLGLAGIGLIFSPNGAGVPNLALFAAIVSGLSVAAHMVIGKKLAYSATQSTICMWTASLTANIAMAFLFERSIPSVTVRAEWLYLVLFAFASVAASWTFIKGAKLMDSATAGVLGLLEIVFGVIFGVVFFDEHPTAVVLTGIALIVVAAALPYLRESRAVAPVSE